MYTAQSHYVSFSSHVVCSPLQSQALRFQRENKYVMCIITCVDVWALVEGWPDRNRRTLRTSGQALDRRRRVPAAARLTSAFAECGGAPARKLAGAYSPFPHPSFCLAVSRRSSLVVMGGNDGDGDHGVQDQGEHLGAQHGARRRPYAANTRRIATSTSSPTAAAAPCSISRALRRREDHHHHHHYRRRAVLVDGLARPSQGHPRHRRPPPPHRARHRALCDTGHDTTRPERPFRLPVCPSPP
jgi:hypothetical protein